MKAIIKKPVNTQVKIVERETLSTKEWMKEFNISSFSPEYLYSKDSSNCVGIAQIKDSDLFAVLTRDVMLWYDEPKYVILKHSHKFYKKLVRSAYGVKGKLIASGTKEQCQKILDAKFWGRPRWEYILDDLKKKYV